MKTNGKTKTKAKRAWTRRPTVKKKCGKCGLKKPHGTFLIRSDNKTRTNSRCVECERTRQKNARAARKATAAKPKVKRLAKASA